MPPPHVRLAKSGVQNKSPSALASLPSASLLSASTVHSHAGYSWSSIAIGSCLFFRKFRPLNTVPAGTLETILAAALLCSFWIGRFSRSGEDVNGVLKGCAAEVEVAAGLSFGLEFVAVVVCAVTACARREADEDIARRENGVALPLARRFRHLRQIIVRVWVRS